VATSLALGPIYLPQTLKGGKLIFCSLLGRGKQKNQIESMISINVISNEIMDQVEKSVDEFSIFRLFLFIKGNSLDFGCRANLFWNKIGILTDAKPLPDEALLFERPTGSEL
jgi:hypothetical protein